MDDMRQVLALADSLGLSREAIKVPLAPQGEGSVERLPGGQFRIVLPANQPLASWLPTLAERLRELLGA